VVDWQAIEAAYRAGECSVRELARQENVSEGAIRKRAKAKGWPARGTRSAGAHENRAISEAGTHPGTQFRDQYARGRAREGGTHSNPVEINGPEWAADPELKPEERAGGWDPASLATYRRERERAAARRTVGADELVGGLVVTEFERPRPRRPVLEGSGMNSKHYSPWRWGGR